MIVNQGTILSEFQKEIEEIKIAALESEKAIEKENSRRELNSNFQDQIFPHEEQERIFDMSRSSDMDDMRKEELIEDFVCAEIEACLKDKKDEKEEIIVDYVQSLPSFTSIIQLPPQSQLELVQLSHGYFLSPHQYALLKSDYQLQVICDMQHKSHVEGTTIKKGTLRAFQWSHRNGIHKTYKDKGDTLKSAIWNPELLLWIFTKQFQKICRMAYKVWDPGKTCFHKHWWRF
ncbi:hypothetical protein PIB30_071896 [Stylosanthes scabra]|uniref:Uncharacterized protein n=1 Tax=Stylosanthes scabra TaxID=79078 RepID=A0ABU6ZMR2_9FABA|nr:hypothetical protein [Stylosanthes scabra]